MRDIAFPLSGGQVMSVFDVLRSHDGMMKKESVGMGLRLNQASGEARSEMLFLFPNPFAVSGNGSGAEH